MTDKEILKELLDKVSELETELNMYKVKYGIMEVTSKDLNDIFADNDFWDFETDTKPKKVSNQQYTDEDINNIANNLQKMWEQ